MPFVVDTAPRQALPYGLFSQIQFRPAGELRWTDVNGVTWESLDCAPASGVAHLCVDPDEKGATFGGDTPEGMAFTVYAMEVCSPIGRSFEDAQNRATAKLLELEQTEVERAIWSGLYGAKPFLIDAIDQDLNDLGTAAAAEALIDLEQGYSSSLGSLGVIHMSRGLALRYIALDQIIRVSNRLETGVGTPVVAGAGYVDGSMVATPPLFGYRSDIFAPGEDEAARLDRGQNNRYAIAERSYFIGWDPCVWQIDVTTP